MGINIIHTTSGIGNIVQGTLSNIFEDTLKPFSLNNIKQLLNKVNNINYLLFTLSKTMYIR